jgi:hypothetical protein
MVMGNLKVLLSIASCKARVAASVASPQEAGAEESIPNPILDIDRTVLVSDDAWCDGWGLIGGCLVIGIEGRECEWACCGRLPCDCGGGKGAATAVENGFGGVPLGIDFDTTTDAVDVCGTPCFGAAIGGEPPLELHVLRSASLMAGFGSEGSFRLKATPRRVAAVSFVLASIFIITGSIKMGGNHTIESPPNCSRDVQFSNCFWQCDYNDTVLIPLLWSVVFSDRSTAKLTTDKLLDGLFGYSTQRKAWGKRKGSESPFFQW